MSEQADRENAVIEKRRSLRCEACGSGNRLSQESLEEGWYRCGHCASPSPVPGVGDFAIQGPAGRVTRVVRPGSSEFETVDDLILPRSHALGWLVVANLVAGGVVHALETYSPQYAAATKIFLVAILLIGWGIAYLGMRTRQRLEVRADRVEFCLRTFRFEWRRRSLATERFHTLTYDDRRPGVELRTPDGRVFIHMEGRQSRRWLEREIMAAIEDARGSGGSDWLACPGCGGPVAPEKNLRNAGGIECPHCLTGLVQTAGGIVMPPAEISHHGLDSVEPAACPARPGGPVLEWSAPPWSRTYPKAWPLNLAAIFLICAAVVGAAWWGVLVTPILEVVAAAAALGVTIGTCKAFPQALLWICGAHTFRLGDRALEHSVRLGGRVYKRRTIPLTRLVSLKAERRAHRLSDDHDDEITSDAIGITARTATGEVAFEAYGNHMQPVVRAVFAEIPARLEALGRQVKRTRAHI